MSKIISAYVEEAPKPKLNLLKSINSQELGEGAFDSLKAAFGGGKKAAPAPKDDTPNRALADNNSADLSSPFVKMVEEILQSPQDDRYVIFASLKFIGANYLKAGGGKGVIDSLKSDEDILGIVSAGEKQDDKSKDAAKTAAFEIRKMKPNFTASDIAEISSSNPNFNGAVLMDIPKILSTNLETEKSSGAANKIREVLVKMMSFKYYVATLNLGAFRKAAPKIDAAKDLEDKVKQFNILTIIANYPVKSTWDAAKIEWKNEYNGGSWKSKDGTTEANSEEGEEGEEDSETSGTAKDGIKVSKTPSGGLDLQKSLITAIMAGEKNAEEIALDIFNSLNKLFTFDQVSQELTMIGHKFDSNFVLDKLHKELAAKKDIWTLQQPTGDKSKPQPKAEPAKEPAAAE